MIGVAVEIVRGVDSRGEVNHATFSMLMRGDGGDGLGLVPAFSRGGCQRGDRLRLRARLDADCWTFEKNRPSADQFLELRGIERELRDPREIPNIPALFPIVGAEVAGEIDVEIFRSSG